MSRGEMCYEKKKMGAEGNGDMCEIFYAGFSRVLKEVKMRAMPISGGRFWEVEITNAKTMSQEHNDVLFLKNSKRSK